MVLWPCDPATLVPYSEHTSSTRTGCRIGRRTSTRASGNTTRITLTSAVQLRPPQLWTPGRSKAAVFGLQLCRWIRRASTATVLLRRCGSLLAVECATCHFSAFGGPLDWAGLASSVPVCCCLAAIPSHHHQSFPIKATSCTLPRAVRRYTSRTTALQSQARHLPSTCGQQSMSRSMWLRRHTLDSTRTAQMLSAHRSCTVTLHSCANSLN